MLQCRDTWSLTHYRRRRIRSRSSYATVRSLRREAEAYFPPLILYFTTSTRKPSLCLQDDKQKKWFFVTVVNVVQSDSVRTATCCYCFGSSTLMRNEAMTGSVSLNFFMFISVLAVWLVAFLIQIESSKMSAIQEDIDREHTVKETKMFLNRQVT